MQHNILWDNFLQQNRWTLSVLQRKCVTQLCATRPQNTFRHSQFCNFAINTKIQPKLWTQLVLEVRDVPLCRLCGIFEHFKLCRCVLFRVTREADWEEACGSVIRRIMSIPFYRKEICQWFTSIRSILNWSHASQLQFGENCSQLNESDLWARNKKRIFNFFGDMGHWVFAKLARMTLLKLEVSPNEPCKTLHWCNFMQPEKALPLSKWPGFNFQHTSYNWGGDDAEKEDKREMNPLSQVCEYARYARKYAGKVCKQPLIGETKGRRHT